MKPFTIRKIRTLVGQRWIAVMHNEMLPGHLETSHPALTHHEAIDWTDRQTRYYVHPETPC